MCYNYVITTINDMGRLSRRYLPLIPVSILVLLDELLRGEIIENIDQRKGIKDNRKNLVSHIGISFFKIPIVIVLMWNI